MQRKRVSLFDSIPFPLSNKTAEAKIDLLLETQFAAGRLYASVASRPGQSGRADGYILEGKELEVRNPLFDLWGTVNGYPYPVLRQKVEDWKAEALISYLLLCGSYCSLVRPKPDSLH